MLDLRLVTRMLGLPQEQRFFQELAPDVTILGKALFTSPFDLNI